MSISRMAVLATRAATGAVETAVAKEGAEAVTKVEEGEVALPVAVGLDMETAAQEEGQEGCRR